MKYDRNPLFPILADKYAVKAYAQERGVQTADLLYLTTEPETIPFDKLPSNYLIKANHGWNWNIFCQDGAFFFYHHEPKMSLPTATQKPHVTELSRDDCVRLCRHWLETRYDSGEWVYGAMEPRIIVEEALEDVDHADMSDYRFFTFGGRVEVIEFDNDAFRRKDYGFFADREWKQHQVSPEEMPPNPPPCPENLAEMIAVAERLAAGIDFLRVDLYNTTKGICLGEITLFPEAGDINSPSHDRAFNRWIGDLWTLDKRHFRKMRPRF